MNTSTGVLLSNGFYYRVETNNKDLETDWFCEWCHQLIIHILTTFSEDTLYIQYIPNQELIINLTDLQTTSPQDVCLNKIL